MSRRTRALWDCDTGSVTEWVAIAGSSIALALLVGVAFTEIGTSSADNLRSSVQAVLPKAASVSP